MSFIQDLVNLSFVDVFKTSIALIAAYWLIRAIYNIFFHPLRKIPGPLFTAASEIPHVYACFTGTGVAYVKSIHDRYGPVVRIGPNRVSFNTASAMRQIYGRRPGKPGYAKDPDLYIMPPSGAPGIGESDDVNHARQRRYLAPAFSEKALREQEYLIQGYVDLLVQGLRDRAGQEVNLVPWFDWTTFDIMGCLALGYEFDCLSRAAYHPWISDMVTNFKLMGLVYACKSFAGLSTLLEYLIPRYLAERRDRNFQFVRDLVKQRIASGNTTRKDFMSYILQHADPAEVRDKELETNAWSILIAGSETSATLLDGTIYHLLVNRGKMEKLTTEIRTAFSSEQEISFARVSGLPYLVAVLDEASRVYPPAPFGLSRVVPEGGDAIDGIYVPGGTKVSVSHWCLFRSMDNFTDPDSFIPERWLETRDAIYQADRRDALMPFSTGPRNCIGKSLALVQMRLILARLLWNFDLELCDSSGGWDDQKAWMAWIKPALRVRVIPRALPADGSSSSVLA